MVKGSVDQDKQTDATGSDETIVYPQGCFFSSVMRVTYLKVLWEGEVIELPTRSKGLTT